jgi:hypothetical protein
MSEKLIGGVLFERQFTQMSNAGKQNQAKCVVYILNNIYDTAGNKLFYLPAAPV